jgi:hypothetical protein
LYDEETGETLADDLPLLVADGLVRDDVPSMI